jgi:hypothetical protein
MLQTFFVTNVATNNHNFLSLLNLFSLASVFDHRVWKSLCALSKASYLFLKLLTGLLKYQLDC